MIITVVPLPQWWCWILLLCRPIVVIDGQSYRKMWRGRFKFMLSPGTHRIASYVYHPLFPRFSCCSCEVMVSEGESTEVRLRHGCFRGTFKRRLLAEPVTATAPSIAWPAAVNAGTLVGVSGVLLALLTLAFALSTTYWPGRPFVWIAAIVAWLSYAIAAVPIEFARLRSTTTSVPWPAVKARCRMPSTRMSRLMTLMGAALILATVSSFVRPVAMSAVSEHSIEPYAEEHAAVIGRGLVAVPRSDDEVFLSWRRLPADSEETLFEVHRRMGDASFQLLGQTHGTSYVDRLGSTAQPLTYGIRPAGATVDDATTAVRWDGPTAVLAYDLGQEYEQARVVTGDLTGDGEPEVIVAHANCWNVDPWDKAWRESTDTMKITAFHRSGERLWTRDLGPGIEAGNVYAPVVVWDLDADGKAEVLVKLNASGDRLNYGADQLAILDGSTGNILRTAPWPSADGLGGDYNSDSRNYIGIAHLDGKRLSIIVARGLYKTQRLWAYDAQLNRIWERIVGREITRVRNRWAARFWRRMTRQSRGSHYLPIVDLNGDGREEILWGEHCIGPGGRDLWAIDERVPYYGHPDVVYAADILPDHPGLEIFYCREGWSGANSRIGMLLASSSGQTLWSHWGLTHVDGGWAARLERRAGMHCYSFDVHGKSLGRGATYRHLTHHLFDAKGRSEESPTDWQRSFPVDWDGDGIYEVCTTSGDIVKYRESTVDTVRPTVLWGADLFGDHREEIVTAPGGGRIYIHFNVTAAISQPRVTPLVDRQYRNDLSRTAYINNPTPLERGIAFVGYAVQSSDH